MSDPQPPPPAVLFGIPLKALLAIIVFLAVVLLVVDPGSFRERLFAPQTPPSPTSGDELVATPEMIAEAARELQQQKARAIEAGGESAPQQHLSYLVELVDGGTLEARSLTIKPDSVTIVSDGGLTTVVPRERVKKLYRLAPPASPDGR